MPNRTSHDGHCASWSSENVCLGNDRNLLSWIIVSHAPLRWVVSTQATAWTLTTGCDSLRTWWYSKLLTASAKYRDSFCQKKFATINFLAIHIGEVHKYLLNLCPSTLGREGKQHPNYSDQWWKPGPHNLNPGPVCVQLRMLPPNLGCSRTCCMTSGWSSRIRRKASLSPSWLAVAFFCFRVRRLKRYVIILSRVAQHPVQTIVSEGKRERDIVTGRYGLRFLERLQLKLNDSTNKMVFRLPCFCPKSVQMRLLKNLRY